MEPKRTVRRREGWHSDCLQDKGVQPTGYKISWIGHGTGRAHVRWGEDLGEDGSRRQGTARSTVWDHSAVAGARIEEHEPE
jgi:hypothetical protein